MNCTSLKELLEMDLDEDEMALAEKLAKEGKGEQDEEVDHVFCFQWCHTCGEERVYGEVNGELNCGKCEQGGEKGAGLTQNAKGEWVGDAADLLARFDQLDYKRVEDATKTMWLGSLPAKEEPKEEAGAKKGAKKGVKKGGE